MIPRNLIQDAFPNQPRMQLAVEALFNDVDAAVTRLAEGLAAISSLSDGATGLTSALAGKEDKSDNLASLSALPVAAGVIEQVQAGIFNIRPVDTADAASLISREVADSRYAPGGIVASPPASATSAGTPGRIAYDSSFLYVCVAANTWRRAALASW